MANWGLLGGLAEGVREGIKSYRTEQAFQNQMRLEQERRQREQEQFQANLVSKGLERDQATGQIVKTAAQQQREQEQDMWARAQKVGSYFGQAYRPVMNPQTGAPETYGENAGFLRGLPQREVDPDYLSYKQQMDPTLGLRTQALQSQILSNQYDISKKQTEELERQRVAALGKPAEQADKDFFSDVEATKEVSNRIRELLSDPEVRGKLGPIAGRIYGSEYVADPKIQELKNLSTIYGKNFANMLEKGRKVSDFDVKFAMDIGPKVLSDPDVVLTRLNSSDKALDFAAREEFKRQKKLKTNIPYLYGENPLYKDLMQATPSSQDTQAQGNVPQLQASQDLSGNAFRGDQLKSSGKKPMSIEEMAKRGMIKTDPSKAKPNEKFFSNGKFLYKTPDGKVKDLSDRYDLWERI